MRFKNLYFLISLVFLIPSIYSILAYGFKSSVEFTGGTEVRFTIQNSRFEGDTEGFIKEVLDEIGIIDPKVSTNNGIYKFESRPVTQDRYENFKTRIKEVAGEYNEISFITIGPSVSSELITKTIFAIILAAGFIMIYVTWQFKDKMYGVAAISAMFHDTLILLGAYSLLGRFKGISVDILFVTAVLTTLSFSVHDTIVVFDRIRESVRKNPKENFYNLVNKSVTETLTRSINNSMTIIFMLLSLFLLGGNTIKWFVFALLIGTVSGTYSSTFCAAPLLLLWKKFFK